MLPVTTSAVLGTSIRRPEYWLPIVAKLSIREMQIPVRKAKPWQEDMSRKAERSNYGSDKGFFLTNFPLNFHDHHLAVDFFIT